MSNYIIEDEVEDYEFVEPAEKTSPSKKVFGGIIILIIMIIAIIIANKVQVRSSYSSLEIEMVNKAEKYLKRSGEIEEDEVYVDVEKINISLPDNCNVLSGVLYSHEEYIPYLYCDDYKSHVFNNDDYLSIKGEKIIFLTIGSKYYELGYNSSQDIQISGDVDTSKEGVYNIYYIPKNGNYAMIRKVIVVDNETADSFKPVITIDRDEMELELGETYIENVRSVDIIDGNITNKIVKIGEVNEEEVGEYKIIYSVTDSMGYTTMKSRNITVLNRGETNIITSFDKENMSNNNIEINVKIIGDNYSYTILPDKRREIATKFTYEVKENGKYTFEVVNKDESSITKTVSVNNIDKTRPTGSCSATLYSDKTLFSVNVDSFNYIVGYNYRVEGKESGYLPTSSYTFGVGGKNNISVTVKDYIGNEETFDCLIKERKSSIDPNGYNASNTKFNDYRGSRLRIPIADALSSRGYTVNDLNRCIYSQVESATPYTRYGVVAAAYSLIECTYKMTGSVLSYNHTSGKVHVDSDTDYCKYNSDICGKLGINRRWGEAGGTCKTEPCFHGLNCATFVRWAMCNGGMNLCTGGSAGAYGMVNVKYFPEADGVTIVGDSVSYYSGRNLTNYSAYQLVRMIKPGDVLAQQRGGDSESQHAYVVIGVDNNAIYTANDGYFYERITFDTMLKGEYSYRILFLDNYYNNPSNHNGLYN